MSFKDIDQSIKNLEYNIETKNLPWIDIDEKNELETAKKIFSSMGN